MKRQTSTVLTAPAGTGKSYFLVHDLVTKILPQTDKRVLTNLYFGPVPESHTTPPRFEGETFLDRIESYCNTRYGEAIAASVKSRIVGINVEWLGLLKVGQGFDGLKDWEVSNAVIILDEAHNFCGSKHPKAARRAWQDFCGELRHRGASIVFVTQAISKLAAEVVEEAGKRQALVDVEEERDPFFGIQFYYWYQLRAKFVGEYISGFMRIDFRDIDGKKSKRSGVEFVTRRPEIFELYDSASAPEAGGQSSSVETHGEWSKRSWPSLLRWFVWHNVERFAKPLAVVAAFVIVFLFGGRLFGWCAGALTAFGGSGSGSISPAVVGRGSPVPSSVQVAGAAGVGAPRGSVAPAVPDVVVERDSLAAEIQAMRGRASALRMVAPDRCAFADAIPLRVGDVVDTGFFSGDKIEIIDYPRRSVRVGDTWLRLASSEHRPAGAALPAVSTSTTDSADRGRPARDDSSIRPAAVNGGQAISDPIRR